MFYLFALMPPPELHDRIVKFQRSFLDNTLPDRLAPHITVRAPIGLSDDREWLPEASAAVAAHQPFTVQLGGIGTFPQGFVFVKVERSPELLALHKSLLKALGKEGRGGFSHQGEDYTPHLTLAGTKWGMNAKSLVALERLAGQELQALGSFEATCVRVLCYSEDDAVWRHVTDLPLGT